jgi:hypothetical protein
MRFIGEYDTKPVADQWRFQRDYGFLRADNMLVIVLEGGKTDGASIPRPLWAVLGHPLHGNNKYWSAPHDAGYHRFVLIIDCNKLPEGMTPETAFHAWGAIWMDAKAIVHQSGLTRKWWDETLLQAMRCLREPWWKRVLTYSGVRVGGWRAWRQGHTSKAMAVAIISKAAQGK